ncbi:DUF368 domain-containing protein [Bacillus kwashiorkori]|uniref:DUF368 domain-containing protein n=1 Tax=Bacillus kwashiorkori TaxID=1522318 RepID=UPI0007819006|nr:DUF368 domain-containing protein [Bacillus kwashiorkori]
MEWKNLYRGFLMGISDLIPGVSGGTIAFILGIYDRLLAAISGFFSREWKKHLGFLIPLALGMGSAILLLSRLIKYLLEYYHEPTRFFFLGLVLGVIPFIMKQANIKRNFKVNHYLILAIAIIVLVIMAFMRSDKVLNLGESLSALEIAGLFFSGWLGSMAMLLPGISGSFILLLLGVYDVVINALSNLNITIIAIVGAGVAVGFIVSSKAIQYALKHFQHATYAAIIGLIIGSIFIIYPGFPENNMLIISIISFIVGLFVSYYLGKVNKD